MKQLHSQGIVLSRTNYGEADRIVTLLTPDSGKISLVARGVRRPKSKMAGGIELFSISDFTYITGRGSLGTMISTRLETHYGKIITQIERVQLGYEVIKMLHRATEDEPEPEYFTMLVRAFEGLNDISIQLETLRLWFTLQLLSQAGHAPNLHTTANGERLFPDRAYSFDFDAVSFQENPQGSFNANHIKYLRLAIAGTPKVLQQVAQGSGLAKTVMPIAQTMLTSYIRV